MRNASLKSVIAASYSASSKCLLPLASSAATSGLDCADAVAAQSETRVIARRRFMSVLLRCDADEAVVVVHGWRRSGVAGFRRRFLRRLLLRIFGLRRIGDS